MFKLQERKARTLWIVPTAPSNLSSRTGLDGNLTDFFKVGSEPSPLFEPASWRAY